MPKIEIRIFQYIVWEKLFKLQWVNADKKKKKTLIRLCKCTSKFESFWRLMSEDMFIHIADELFSQVIL